MYYFSDCNDAASFEYSLYHEPEKYYDPVVQNLTHEESRTGKKVIVSCTNRGSVTADSVECTALFFRDGKLIGRDFAYFTDNDSELKPGRTITKEMSCYEQYDDVKLYFSAIRYNW